MSDDECAAVMAQREKFYGPIEYSFESVALGWTGILRAHYRNASLPPLSPDIVALMMAHLKIIRSCRVYKEDNYIDGKNYFDIAEQLARPKEQK